MPVTDGSGIGQVQMNSRQLVALGVGAPLWAVTAHARDGSEPAEQVTHEAEIARELANPIADLVHAPVQVTSSCLRMG